jgi:hypothetical protein
MGVVTGDDFDLAVMIPPASARHAQAACIGLDVDLQVDAQGRPSTTRTRRTLHQRMLMAERRPTPGPLEQVFVKAVLMRPGGRGRSNPEPDPTSRPIGHR